MGRFGRLETPQVEIIMDSECGACKWRKDERVSIVGLTDRIYPLVDNSRDVFT